MFPKMSKSSHGPSLGPAFKISLLGQGVCVQALDLSLSPDAVPLCMVRVRAAHGLEGPHPPGCSAEWGWDGTVGPEAARFLSSCSRGACGAFQGISGMVCDRTCLDHLSLQLRADSHPGSPTTLRSCLCSNGIRFDFWVNWACPQTGFQVIHL